MTFATGVKSKMWEYQYKAEDPSFPEIPKLRPVKVSLIVREFLVLYIQAAFWLCMPREGVRTKFGQL